MNNTIDPNTICIFQVELNQPPVISKYIIFRVKHMFTLVYTALNRGTTLS